MWNELANTGVLGFPPFDKNSFATSSFSMIDMLLVLVICYKKKTMEFPLYAVKISTRAWQTTVFGFTMSLKQTKQICGAENEKNL